MIIIVTMTSQRGHEGHCTAEGRWGCFRNDNLVLQSLHTEGSLQGEGNVGNTRHRRIKSDARGVAGAFRKQSSPFGRCSNCVKVLLRPSPPGSTPPCTSSEACLGASDINTVEVSRRYPDLIGSLQGSSVSCTFSRFTKAKPGRLTGAAADTVAADRRGEVVHQALNWRFNSCIRPLCKQTGPV